MLLKKEREELYNCYKKINFINKKLLKGWGEWKN